MRKKVSDFDMLCKPLLVFAGVEQSTSYNTPAIKLKSKLLMRLREDNASIVIRVDLHDSDKLLCDRPEVFFLTDHYVNYPYILAYLHTLLPDELVEVLGPQLPQSVRSALQRKSRYTHCFFSKYCPVNLYTIRLLVTLPPSQTTGMLIVFSVGL